MDCSKEDIKFRFNIDRGGTFTDIYCEYSLKDNQTKSCVYKLLSQDLLNYEDAPSEGIRRIIQNVSGINLKKFEKIPTKFIESIRMGTTIATNALLERKGERCALLITEGFKDLLEIGNQTRPNIFDLKIERPDKIYECVYEVKERVRILPNYNPNSNNLDCNLAKVRQGTTGEYIEILKDIDEEEIKSYLNLIYNAGIRSLAVALVHSYTFRDHENLIKRLAQEFGFENISISSQIMPLVKFYPRGSTSVVDGYLTPAIYKYVQKFLKYFDDSKSISMNVLFMQSDGGLTNHENFYGSKAILSGPAGGVVGYSTTTSKEIKSTPIIGLDMGGTSTDVSRYDNGWDHVFEIQIAGVAINSPQIDVNTVAAGGGSRLFYKNGMFVVGPESAGAEPGPLCYKKKGYLSVTDANLILGRLIPKHFPKIFGENASECLSYEESYRGMYSITQEINKKETNEKLTVEEVAFGFIKVANEAMCRPIRSLTQARGYDPKDHVLSIFGGAGGQHACALAKLLGMTKVYIHKYAGILSAYGLSKAEIVEELQEPVNKILKFTLDEYLNNIYLQLEKKAIEKLKIMENTNLIYKVTRYLLLRYEGNDYALVVEEKNSNGNGINSGNNNVIINYQNNFEKAFKREYGFLLDNRDVIIDYARVRVSLVPVEDNDTNFFDFNPSDYEITCTNEAQEVTNSYFEINGKLEKISTSVYFWENLEKSIIKGPALIQSGTSTIVIEPECIGYITKLGNLVISVPVLNTYDDSEKNSNLSQLIKKDPLELSLYANRFMGIAEQMGRHLQRTSVSTNIKERLDFSCAIFDSEGNLVANAPHLPVHLGAMQEVVKHQIKYLGESWKKGEVILCNHPQAGGSHLPDMTVISPVYHKDNVIFYVANRGHHSDIGGLTPGSMPPFSKNLDEEGAAIYSFKLVENNTFKEEEVRKIFFDDLISKGIHPSRNLKDNISDLKAQVAANKVGGDLIMEMVDKFGLDKIIAYMKFIQEAAELAVMEMLDNFGEKIGIEKDGEGISCAEDYMDDGSKICLKIKVNRKYKRAVFDFTNTSGQVYGNTNTPRSVTYSAIIYCLRCLINSDIPLNQGCLTPVDIIIPKDSLLWPSETCAVVGGNVTTSQRITDIILKAFNACAASQGDMNNLTFGDDSLGYYETIGGGSGAGPTWHGKSGVQVHMTNTRITDVEIIERRYPVLILNFSLRKNSGGKGKFNGGDGIIRAFKFLSPLKVSILSERRVFSPFGLAGGADGIKGVNLYMNKDGLIFNLGSKNSLNVHPGDSVIIMTPGGGGYGLSNDEVSESNLNTSSQNNSVTNPYFHSYGSLCRYFSDQYSN